MIELGHFLPGAKLLEEEKGVSETYIGVVETSDRRINAYVKLLPDRELANELVVSELARRAGLDTPDAYLVMAARQDYPTSPQFQLQPKALTMPAFATAAMGLKSFRRRADLQSPDAKKAFVGAWKQWADVLGFDDWTANGDRHPGNFLVGGPGEVWLIDHGYAFTGPAWSADKLDPDVLVANRLWNEVLSGCVDEAEKRPATKQIRARMQKFGDVDLQGSFDSAHLRYYLTSTEMKLLKIFLTDRVTSVAMRLCRLLGIPELPLEEVK